MVINIVPGAFIGVKLFNMFSRIILFSIYRPCCRYAASPRADADYRYIVSEVPIYISSHLADADYIYPQ